MNTDTPDMGNRSPPPPRGNLLPSPRCAMSERACGARRQCTASTASGQRTPTARPKDGQPGEGECLSPDIPHGGPSPPPPPLGALMPFPRRATPARKNVRYGVGDGPPHLHPPRPKNKGSGPGLHARRTGGRVTVSA